MQWPRGSYLEVVEGVDEGDEAPGLVPELQGEQRNVPDEHRVKVPSHLQVVTGAGGLQHRATDSRGQRSETPPPPLRPEGEGGIAQPSFPFILLPSCFAYAFFGT